MKPVSNASVLIGLSSIGMLGLLQKRFPEGILIPSAVYREVVNQGKGRTGANEVAKSNWIEVRNVEDQKLVALLRADLDEGEAEAIALAHHTAARVILLDERDARRIAQRMNFRVLGTIGVLIWAKKIGELETLTKYLEELQSRGNFRFSKMLFKRALMEVGEPYT